MITEKATFTVNPTGAPPSYESITNEPAQGINAVDKKDSWPEDDTPDPPYAPLYASKSTPLPPTPKPDDKATISERECFESGGHVVPTIMFRPGGIPAILATVAVAIWNKRPILCERCQTELDEEDFKDIFERRQELCKGKGPAKREWKARTRTSGGCGQRKSKEERRKEWQEKRKEWLEQRKERHERPRCGRSRRNSF